MKSNTPTPNKQGYVSVFHAKRCQRGLHSHKATPSGPLRCYARKCIVVSVLQIIIIMIITWI